MAITVFSYGARLTSDPEVAFSILRLANRYRNKLVELKRDRITCVALSKLPGADLTMEQIRDAYLCEQRSARAVCGLHCGTYGMIANGDAAKAKSFRRFDGTGRIGAPINANGDCVPVPLAFEPNAKVSLSRNGRFWDVALGQGRGAPPVTASVKMHRPLPQDGIIKMAWLQRARIATHFKWCLQLVVEHAHDVPVRRVPGRSVGLDLGWRTRDDTKRVAMLSDGREFLLDAKHFEKMAHARSIQSIADRAFDAVKPHHFMRNRDRLARRVRAGEYPELEGWRQQNRHLTDWHGFERTKCLRARKDAYRKMARSLCVEFDTIYIESFDLRKVAKKDSHADRSGRVATSPSEFRDALRMMAAKHGTRIVEVPAEYTTRICNACRYVNEPSTALTVVCERCCDTSDQDLRAAKNIADLGDWIDANPDRSQSGFEVVEILGALA